MDKGVEQLEGKKLDTAVAQAVGALPFVPLYSSEWEDGGPLIEQYDITIISHADGWSASVGKFDRYIDYDFDDMLTSQHR